MIKSFRHKGLKRFFEDDDRTKLHPDLIERITSILSLLDAASDISDLNRPSLKLHQLKGELKGYWAVTVRANWRITFRFEEASAHDVDFVDYH